MKETLLVYFPMSAREPAATPSDLAGQADAVVTGRIVSVSPGQSYAPIANSDAEITTSVLQVDVEEVVAGDSEVVSDGYLYLEVPHPAFVGPGEPGAEGEGGGARKPFDHEAFAATVPMSFGVFSWMTERMSGTGRP